MEFLSFFLHIPIDYDRSDTSNNEEITASLRRRRVLHTIPQYWHFPLTIAGPEFFRTGQLAIIVYEEGSRRQVKFCLSLSEFFSYF
jgi:hypothetical protein